MRLSLLKMLGNSSGKPHDACAQYYGALAQWQQAKPSGFAATS
jgi:hypothetical protein